MKQLTLFTEARNSALTAIVRCFSEVWWPRAAGKHWALGAAEELAAEQYPAPGTESLSPVPGGYQPITGHIRRQLTNQRPGHAALQSEPGSHIRRGWRPMSQSNVDNIMYPRQGVCGKGKLRPFLIDDLFKTSRIRIPHSEVRGAGIQNTYIHVFISKPKSKAHASTTPRSTCSLHTLRFIQQWGTISL